MKYRVTFIHSSDYCNLKPDDKDCLFSVDIEAPSKAEAVYSYHKTNGMVFEQIRKAVLPIVWEIREL